MQFPESWLREWVDPAIDSDTLAHRLTMSGLEVEGLTPVAPAFSGVVVARILEAQPHPDADRLRVCRVDDGSGEPLQIVCGAPNAAAGLTVPLARVGAELPGGMKIGVARMRGVESSGMLCSARELGLSQDQGGLLELPQTLTPGTSLRDALRLDDQIFDIKMTPNRADCLSIRGVAREVRALTGVTVTAPVITAVTPQIDDAIAVHIEAPDLCGRFAGRVVQGVNARATTPAWMRERLERSGQRSVSALVDISNYVMLELGIPSHVFDRDKFDGDIVVRWAQEGESLELLNGQTVTLSTDIGVVTAGGKVESMAGIMGGEATAVTLDTRNIYIESAFWFPEAIAGKARRYRFGSEASHRYERGVDFEASRDALERITELVIEICGGQAGAITDQHSELPSRKPVVMRLSRCQKILGIEVAADEVIGIFERLGFMFEHAGDRFVVQPPSFRFDLTIEEDLIEEVARIYGFERIPDVPPLARAKMHAIPESVRSPHRVRRMIADRDYQEVVNFSFVEADWERDLAGNTDPITLLNPIASQLAVMRSSLLGGLVANIRHNANHRQSRVRVFEFGRVFMRDATVENGPLSVAAVSQPLRLAGAAWGPVNEEQWGVKAQAVDFYDVKMDVEALFGREAVKLRFVAAAHPALHPGRSARIEFEGQAIGWIGELHPQWAMQNDLTQAPVLFEVDAEAVLRASVPVAADMSRQPMVVRDLALWVESARPAQDLLDTIAQTIASEEQLKVVRDVQVFDVYVAPNSDKKEKSLALRFWLQDEEQSLEDARVETCMTRILDALVQKWGARQRA